MSPPERPTGESAPNDSDIVLMFADQFAEPQDGGYQAPCSQASVSLSSLAREMLATAFISLALKGAIELTPGKKKRLFSEHKTVFVERKGEPADSPTGIDSAILGHLKGKAGEDSVRDVVGRIVGSTTIEPYSAILEMSMDNACRAGYFEQVERTGTAAFLGKKTLPKLFQPRCDRIAGLASRAPEVTAMREKFKGEHPELFEVLYEDVEKSVRSAYFRT